jgi:hypothetical protein
MDLPDLPLRPLVWLLRLLLWLAWEFLFETVGWWIVSVRPSHLEVVALSGKDRVHVT